MKKSVLLALALLVTIPAYMTFIISRSDKSPDKMLRQYYYPHISTFSIDPQVSVWLAQSDTNYLYCMGCDTTGIFKSGNLSIAKHENQQESFTVLNEYMHYKLGLKELGSVISQKNKIHISDYKQKKLGLVLGEFSKITLEKCDLDTLHVIINGWGQKELVLLSDCRVKHISIEGSNGLSHLLFTCTQGVTIESLVVNNVIEKYFELGLYSGLLAKIDFKLNGKQITTGKTEADSTDKRVKND